MSSETIPAWAMEEAAKALGVPQDDTGWHQTGGILPAIALALLAAEQRGRKAGLEEAADHLGQMAKDTPLGHENIQRGRSTYNWLRYCEAAIRSLGEKT